MLILTSTTYCFECNFKLIYQSNLTSIKCESNSCIYGVEVNSDLNFKSINLNYFLIENKWKRDQFI